MDNGLARIKICFIVGTLARGGAERQLFYMLQTLRDQGSRPVVLSLTRGEFWESRIKGLGIEVIWVGRRKSRLVRLLRIIAKVRETRPHIVQSSHFFTNIYAAGAGIYTGIPSIGALRNDCVSEVRDAGRILGKLSLKAPRIIAGNSMAGIKAAMAMGVDRHRLFFLPNVIDLSSFPPAVQTNRDATIRLLTAGRLVDQKRMDRFIRLIARLLKEQHVSIKGIIVGDGPLLTSLRELAEQHGLSPDELQFRGLVSDMALIYGEADIFVLTSDWEGTPNVVLEAMASGLTVVASRVGGIADIIDDGRTGFLFNMDDEQRLFDICNRLIIASPLRQTIGQKAREEVDQRYSLTRLPDYITSLYQLTRR